MRQLSLVDKLLCQFDVALRTIAIPKHRECIRNNPARSLPEPLLNLQEKSHVAGLMRVNHAGEVAAQALYQGQALTARLPNIRTQMEQAALEEIDHLSWCEERLRELDSQPSILNPLWYSGSLMLGALAGLIGDKWSLGFVAETERQVTQHLKQHLAHLPKQDTKTTAILSQMHEDEAHHAKEAQRAGAAELPLLIKKGMQVVSKFLTKSSYYI